MGSESRSPLDTFLLRLRTLGASEDEVRAACASWPSATDEERAWALNVDDVTLAREIERVRTEYAEHTTVEGGPVSPGASGNGSPST